MAEAEGRKWQKERWVCWITLEEEFSCISQCPSRKQMAHSSRVIKEEFNKVTIYKGLSGVIGGLQRLEPHCGATTGGESLSRWD